MAPFHLLGPALLKPTSPLLQLHQPAALLLPLPLNFAVPKKFKLYQIPGMPGADVIYTLFPLSLLAEQFLTWFACVSMPDHLLAKSPSLFSCFLNFTTLATCLPYLAFDVRVSRLLH
jgi:hypothetical protein